MWPSRKDFLNNAIVLHVLCWSVFIAYEVSLVKIVRASQGLTDSLWKDYVLSYLFNIALFYFHALFTLPQCFEKGKKRTALFSLLLFIELLTYLLLIGLKELTFLESKVRSFSSLYPSEVAFIRQVWRGIYFLIFSTAYWLIQNSFKKERRLKEVEKQALVHEKEKQELELELMASQNAFLQAQINPHLLFNTLNFIHSEVQQTSPKASEAIITLSDMMRYSLAEIKKDGKVELEKEIEQIENLLQINQYRFNHQLFVEFTCRDNYGKARIVPLLLVPFVENLFKYGDLTDSDHPARIHLRCESNFLEFATYNKKRKMTGFFSTGIGIKNVTTRLNSSYADRYTLEIQNQDSIYSVNLAIQL